MSERGQGFYIPAYQREYSWGNANIIRLFDDIGHGTQLLLDRNDATTFIGTLITIHDTEYATVDPIVRRQVPGRVLTVIDGQQRLTTLLLINIALHGELSTRQTSFEDSSDDAMIWIHEQCVETLAHLVGTLEEDMSHGDGDYRWYPRMTRAYQYKWSRNATEAVYGSEIASLLHQYGSHARQNPTKRFTPAHDTKVAKYLGTIRRTLRDAVARDDHEDIEFPSTKDIANKQPLARVLFNDLLPSEVARVLLGGQDPEFEQLFRLLVFARFVLRRVAVTVVTAKSEDYAFDMFESLNTTGEPLTAIETFRPRVIREVGLTDYSSSPENACMSQVENFVEKFKMERRQAITSSLLIPFALAENGKRLSKRLNEQRRYLRESYENFDDTERIAFLRHLADTARFLRGAWNRKEWKEEVPRLDGVGSLVTQEQMCLDVIRSANHTIAVVPLARFYSAQRDGQDVAIGQAIRAVTAFFALWRGAKGGTAGIDDKYRQLLSAGSPADGIPPLARSAGVVPDTAHLKSYFRGLLIKEDIGSRESWVEKASVVPVYFWSRPLARLLLLAAMHDTVPDEGYPGLPKQGRPGVRDLLEFEIWNDENNITVEHVAPASPDEADGWSESLYADSDLKNRLGNLLLLSSSRNASVSNKSRQYKQTIFRVLSARSVNEAVEIVEAAKRRGIVVPRELAEEGEYLPLAASVASYDGDWNVDIVDKRSEVLAGLAWDRLAPWLEIVE